MSATCAVPKSDKIDGLDKWEVEEAARTLQRAFEIRQNKKLLNAAIKVLKKTRTAAEKALKWSDQIKT